MKSFLHFKKVVFIFFFSLSSVFAQFSSQSSNSNSDQLYTAGAISVTIGGNFIVTGSFPALVTDRVDQFVTRLYNQIQSKLYSETIGLLEKKELEKELEGISFRNVTLKRKSGEEFKLDLLKFRRTGDFSQNPYLKNDDVIIFAPTDLKRNFFNIDGAVNNPGKFSFVDGDKLSDAITLANGLNKAYENVDSVEINRLSYNGEDMQTIKLSVNSDFKLQRGDRITVVADETQRKDFKVTVFGEVNFPGNIPITKNSTTLTEVIKKAGGITGNASLQRAKLFTGNNFNLLVKKLYNVDLKDTPLDTAMVDRFLKLDELMMNRMDGLTREEKEYFSVDNEVRILTDGTSVNFIDYDKPGSEASQFYVHNNDIIIIPAKSKTIQVFGQVTNPGRINYVEGKDINYYIDKAGGLGQYAIDDEITLIKGESRRWVSIEDESYKIEPGDYIWVPREIIRGFNYYLQQVATYLGIVASAATVVLLLLKLNPNN